jgi:AhpD family alkylhydroperoxidase
MTLVPMLEKSQTDGEARATLDRGEQLWGRLLNTWMVLANTPDILTAYLPFLRSVAGPGELNQRIKELVAVQVAIDTHCLYTASHRCSSALRQGVAEAELDALAAGDLTGFTQPEALALQLAHELTYRPTELRYDDAPQLASPELLSEVQKTFPPEALVELVMSIAVWNALARFHRTMGLELDMPEPPASVRAAL